MTSNHCPVTQQSVFTLPLKIKTQVANSFTICGIILQFTKLEFTCSKMYLCFFFNIASPTKIEPLDAKALVSNINIKHLTSLMFKSIKIKDR